MKRKLYQSIALAVSFLLACEQSGFAQVVQQLDLAGCAAVARSATAGDKFRPARLRYLSYEGRSNTFKLLVDQGDAKGIAQGEITRELMKYFSIGIALPNDAFWVNLRPDGGDKVIDPALERTDMGRALLEADVRLKKDISARTSPDTPEGKAYWDKLYKKAQELYGREEITIPTVTRPWIVPDEIIIRETPGGAYIYKSTLKVMLAQDYLKDSAASTFADPRSKVLNEYSSQLIRELIIPGLTKSVNSSRGYAVLRQVYSSLILAQWFKARFSGKAGAYARRIDAGDLNGLVSAKPWSKESYFEQYRKSFKDGEYDLKRTVQTVTGQTVRSYFSGGFVCNVPIPELGNSFTGSGAAPSVSVIPGDPAITPGADRMVSVQADGGRGKSGNDPQARARKIIDQLIGGGESSRAEDELMAQFKGALGLGQSSRSEEKKRLGRELVSLGKAITPLLIDILRSSNNAGEKTIVLDALRIIADETALDVLLDVIDEETDASFSLFDRERAIRAIVGLGKAASPRLKSLLQERGARSNVILAITELRDESFVPLLKELRVSDGVTEQMVAKALVALGDKEGLRRFIVRWEKVLTMDESFEDTRDDVLSIVWDMSDLKATVQEMLKPDVSFEERLTRVIRSTLEKSIAGEGNDGDSEVIAELIPLLGLLHSRNAAEVLWWLYTRATGEDVEREEIVAAMKLTGAACVPVITENHGGRYTECYELLGDLGDASAIPFLLKEGRRAGDKQKRVIEDVVGKIGPAAYPYLFDALKEEKGDSGFICELIISLDAFTFIPGAIKSAESRQDVDEFIGIYNRGGVKVKQAVLIVLSATADDAVVSLFVNALGDPESMIAGSALNSLCSLARGGKLQGYLERNRDEEARLLTHLEALLNPRSDYDTGDAIIGFDAVFLLGSIGSERCLVILTEEINRRLSRGEVPLDALEMLIAAGDKARQVVARYPAMIEKVDKALFAELQLSAFNIVVPMQYQKEVYKDWASFIGGSGARRIRHDRQGLINSYVFHRVRVTDLIIRLREYLEKSPDASYEEIMKVLGDGLESVSLPVRARFRAGVITYTHDRRKILHAIREAEKAGIRDGDAISSDELRADSAKASFVRAILGFVPKRVRIQFLNDTIHLTLDGDSYGRMRYRDEKKVSSENDGYYSVPSSARQRFRNNGGVFLPAFRAKIGGVGFSGLVIFENELAMSEDGRVLRHEWLHRFFHGYADDELVTARDARRVSIGEIVCAINAQRGKDRESSVNLLIETMLKTVLFEYQNEMIAKVGDGTWFEEKDISWWFGYYKERYAENVQQQIIGIADFVTRDRVSEEVFSRAERLLKRHKPLVDGLIEARARYVQSEDGADYESALRKADMWVATFLTTVPLNRFERLDWILKRGFGAQADGGMASGNELQGKARQIIDRLLGIGSRDFSRWEEKFRLQRELVSLGKEITPLLLDILRHSKDKAELQIALDTVSALKDGRALDDLLDIVANDLDSNSLGMTAAFAVGRIGKAASPRLKTLLKEHGLRINILRAVEGLSDESFVPLVKGLRAEDIEIGRLRARMLLSAGDKEGFKVLLQTLRLGIMVYEKKKDDSNALTVRILCGDLSGASVRKQVKTILREDRELENQLVGMVRRSVEFIADQNVVAALIGLLETGNSRVTAEALWHLYLRKAVDEDTARVIVHTMKEVGAACIPFMTQNPARYPGLMYEALGDMGDVSVAPFLISEFAKADSGGQTKIVKAMRKLGQNTVPYLVDALRNPDTDNRFICSLARDVSFPETVPALVEAARAGSTRTNRMNALRALGAFSLTNTLSNALRGNSALREELFGLTVSSISDDLILFSYSIGGILRDTAGESDVDTLIELYNRYDTPVKKAVIGALESCSDSKAVSFLIDVLSSPVEEIVWAALSALDALADKGVLQAYLAQDSGREDALIDRLEANAAVSVYAISLLGTLGTIRSVDVLIREIDRRIEAGTDIVVLLEALITAGDVARIKVQREYPGLIADIEGAVMDTISGPEGLLEHGGKVLRVFRKWLYFMHSAPAGTYRTQREFAEAYVSRRLLVTDTIIRLKEYLVENPDAQYGEILRFIDLYGDGLSERAILGLQSGALMYVRDRKRIRTVRSIAVNAGISEGDTILQKELLDSPAKARFIAEMLGFVPARVQIVFLNDTIHIALDQESYGRMRYRQLNRISAAVDDYNKLLPQERAKYKDSGGVFIPYFTGKVGGLALTGLVTFELLDTFGGADMRVMKHELQHRFFHGYMDDVMWGGIALSRKEARGLAEKIAVLSGQERRGLEDGLVAHLTKIVMFDYQNEMLSKIIEGSWLRTGDISLWFESYKERYAPSVYEVLDVIGDVPERETLFAEVFAGAEKLLKRNKPLIDGLIEQMARRIRDEKGVGEEAALEKAEEWAATFFLFVPLSRFERLDWILGYGRDGGSRKAGIAGRDGDARTRKDGGAQAPGGIDFRTLPIVVQSARDLRIHLRGGARGDTDPDREWRKIEKLLAAGISPSAERIEEYVQVSWVRGALARDKAKIVSCICDMLKYDEEQCNATDPVIRDLLIVLESGISGRELKAIFAHS